MIKDSKR